MSASTPAPVGGVGNRRAAAPHTVGWPGGLGRRAAVVGDLGQTHAGYEEEPGTDLRVTDPHTRADDQRPARRHRAGPAAQLLHHRAHRPRQVHPGRPHAPGHRRRPAPRHARPVPGPHGHRARARHHHQVPGRAHALGHRGRRRRHARLRAQHDRHPRARRLLLRGQPLPGRLRGRGPPGRRRPGHPGPDPGQPLHGHRGGPDHHPGPQQDRPARRRAGEARRGDRLPHRLRRRRRPQGLGQDRPGRARAARPDRRDRPAPARRPRGPGPRHDLRLRLRHLPRRGHLRARRRRRPQAPRAHRDALHQGRPRPAGDRRHQPRAHAVGRTGGRRGRLPHHRGQGRAPVQGR